MHLKPSGIGPAGAIIIARFADHGVMRESRLLPLPLSQAAPFPIVVECDLLHPFLPPGAAMNCPLHVLDPALVPYKAGPSAPRRSASIIYDDNADYKKLFCSL